MLVRARYTRRRFLSNNYNEKCMENMTQIGKNLPADNVRQSVLRTCLHVWRTGITSAGLRLGCQKSMQFGPPIHSHILTCRIHLHACNTCMLHKENPNSRNGMHNLTPFLHPVTVIDVTCMSAVILNVIPVPDLEDRKSLEAYCTRTSFFNPAC